ncbi:MAG: cyclase family protein [Nocardioides sp.]
MTLVDLSHPVEHQMMTYPGLPGPHIDTHLSFEDSVWHYAPGTEFQIGRISLVGNTGTYLDTPAHRYRDGHDLAALALERCADLPVCVVAGDVALGPEAFDGVSVAGRAVLLHTGWDRHWRTERYGDVAHPHLTEAGARHLVEAGATLVGIDSVNIDHTGTGERPAHSVLLAAGIPVVEHLTGLGEVRDGDRFFAVPVAIRGLATFPVRAFVVRGDNLPRAAR